MSVSNSEQVNQGLDAAKSSVKLSAKVGRRAGKLTARGGRKVWSLLPFKAKLILITVMIVVIILAIFAQGVASSSFRRVFRPNAINEENDYNYPRKAKDRIASIYNQEIAIEDTIKLVQVIHDAKQKDYDNIRGTVEKAIRAKAAQNQYTNGYSDIDIDLSYQMAKLETAESSGYAYSVGLGNDSGGASGMAEKIASIAERMAWPIKTPKKKYYVSMGGGNTKESNRILDKWYSGKYRHACNVLARTVLCEALGKKLHANYGYNSDSTGPEKEVRKELSPFGFKVFDWDGKESSLRRGDVVFYLKKKGGLEGHTYIYLGPNRAAHAQQHAHNGGTYFHLSGFNGTMDEGMSDKKRCVVVRYTGGGGITQKTGSTSAAFTEKKKTEVIGTITASSGTMKHISCPAGYGVAQSFAADKSGIFFVAFTTGPTTGVRGYVRAFDTKGNYKAQTGADLYHANGSTVNAGGKFVCAGTLQGSERGNKVFSYKGGKLKAERSMDLPCSTSAIGYDEDTNVYALAKGRSVEIYDSSLKHKTAEFKRKMHGAYYQDIAASGGYIFSVHCIKKGGSLSSGKNFIDVYSEGTGAYCGSYEVPFGELESVEIINGEIVLLIHIKGTSDNYIQKTGVTVNEAGAFSSTISKLDMDILAAYNISISNTSMYMEKDGIEEKGDERGWLDTKGYTDVAGKKVKLYWFGKNRGLINYEKDLGSKVDALFKGDAQEDISKHFFKISVGSNIEYVDSYDEDGKPVKKKIVPVTIKECEAGELMAPMFGLEPDEYYVNSTGIRKTKEEEGSSERKGTATNLESTYSLSDNTGRLLLGELKEIQNPDVLGDSEIATGMIAVGSEAQKKILEYIAKVWPASRNPYSNGYAHRCEKWVCDVYKGAGIPTNGSCCAAASRDKNATKSADIPPGAMIYSSSSVYRSGVHCGICGRNAGHVAIYIGNNKVAGSQPTYIMSLDAWTKYFGYGGWSFSGNKF